MYNTSYKARLERQAKRERQEFITSVVCAAIGLPGSIAMLLLSI